MTIRLCGQVEGAYLCARVDEVGESCDCRLAGSVLKDKLACKPDHVQEGEDVWAEVNADGCRERRLEDG